MKWVPLIQLKSSARNCIRTKIGNDFSTLLLQGYPKMWEFKDNDAIFIDSLSYYFVFLTTAVEVLY